MGAMSTGERMAARAAEAAGCGRSCKIGGSVGAARMRLRASFPSLLIPLQ